MKTYYGVTTKFFDDGKVRAFIFEVKADEQPENSYESLRQCDVYKDYFDSLEEAEKHMNDAMNA